MRSRKEVIQVQYVEIKLKVNNNNNKKRRERQSAQTTQKELIYSAVLQVASSAARLCLI